MTSTQNLEDMARGGADVPPRGSAVSFRDVALTAALLVALTAFPPLYGFSGRVGIALVLVVLAVSWVLLRVFSPRWRPSPIVLPSWLILLGLTAPIAMAASPRFASESAIVPLAGVGLLIFFGSGVLSRSAVLVGVALAGGVVGVVTLVDFFAQTVDWFEVMSAASPNASLGELLPLSPPTATPNPSIHPNAAAPIFGLAICASLAVARLPGMSRLAWLAGGFSGFGLVATGSRGGILAAIIGSGVTWIMLADGSASQRKRRMRIVVVGSVVGLVGLLGLWAAGLRPDFIFSATIVDRVPVMRLGLDMFGDSPWVGQGPGAFPYLYPLYGPELFPGFEARLVWIHPHSAYVQSLVEYGMVGTALVASGIVALIVVIARSFSVSQGPRRLAVAAALGAVVLFAVHSVIEPLYLYLAPLSFVVALVAVGVSTEGADTSTRRAMSWGTHLAPLLIVPVVVAMTVAEHVDYLAGRDAVVLEDDDAALTHFGASSATDSLPVYLLARSLVETQAGQQPTSEQGNAIDPYLTGSFHLNLARAALDRNDPVAATKHLATAYPLVRGDETALVEYGFLSIELGADENATSAFVEAVAISPWLSTSPFLNRLPDEMRADVLESAFLENLCWYGDEWILTGAATEDDVEFLTAQCAPSAPANLMTMVQSGEAAEALALATVGLESTPTAVDLRRVAGLAMLELGDLEAARRHLAIGALLDDSYSALALRSTFAAEEVPLSIQRLADSLSGGHSPVLLNASSKPIYVFAALITNHAGNREALPSPLLDGPWQDAYTDLHLQLIETG